MEPVSGTQTQRSSAEPGSVRAPEHPQLLLPLDPKAAAPAHGKTPCSQIQTYRDTLQNTNSLAATPQKRCSVFSFQLILLLSHILQLLANPLLSLPPLEMAKQLLVIGSNPEHPLIPTGSPRFIPLTESSSGL